MARVGVGDGGSGVGVGVGVACRPPFAGAVGLFEKKMNNLFFFTTGLKNATRITRLPQSALEVGNWKLEVGSTRSFVTFLVPINS